MSKSMEGDREEGEIVDDEFEEISDSSMTLNETGKSLSPKEHIPVISLSSVSEAEEELRKIKMRRKIHAKLRHHHRHHHKWKRKMKEKYFERSHQMKNWKRLMINTSSTTSSSDDCYERNLDKFQYQLKAAVRVENEDIHRNSLRARLRTMTKFSNCAEVDKISDIFKSDSDNKVGEQKNVEISEDVDNELIQLRVEALRTAVLNKLEHRRKRKVKDMQENQEISNVDNLETNKENAINENESVNIKKPCLEKSDVNMPSDEDEDVLRALLLASMSKKITKGIEVNKESFNKIETKVNHNTFKPNVFLKKPIAPFRQHIPTKIKPIIININSDTESEDEKCNSATGTVKEPTVTTTKIIDCELENNVEKFLREQRAQVEAQSRQKTVVPQKPKILHGPLPEVSTKPQSLNQNVILEKSSVKLLPKVKQIEYQKLLQRLKNAQKKPRTRRASFKGSEDCNIVKSVKIKNNVCGINRVLDIKQDARCLHAALKQMQKPENGRLQIEEKYVVLTPIIRKINEATTERKKYDQEVKRLTAELASIKGKLQDTHRQFSTYVRELLVKKESIDKSPLQLKKNGDRQLPVTSTPNKLNIPVESLEVSTVPCSANTTPDKTVLKISPDKPYVTSNGSSSKPTVNVHNNLDGVTATIHDAKEKDIFFKLDEEIRKESQNVVDIVVNGVDTIETNVDGSIDNGINPGDPNDIHRMYENQYNFFPEYISPLDSIKRDNTYDPFVIMCPFDIDGNCRDLECIYRHYSR